MTLLPGARLGPYEIVSPLGAGGMGEVYRARDTKLGRDVALKILPDVFASDPERLARFEREAKTLAALNHPHIAHLYGFEQTTSGASQISASALVMELVEGDDLAHRIARGPIPLDEALTIARQIAEALEAAHEQGIVHRDLKPANIKVRDDGTVKVLDFGLAKALEGSSRAGGSGGSSGSGRGAEELLNSPTITSPAMTMRGMILGTAAYMAPEQAKGKTVDKRADIWAFGCVLYEMLTGRRAFSGDDVSDTLAVVLRGDPDWTSVPAPARRLLKKCLEKDPRRRLHDIGDAWDLIGEPESSATTGSRRALWLAWGVAGVMLATTAALAVVHFREDRSLPPAVRFELLPPPKSNYDIYIALSPDGRRLAFTARDDAGRLNLWLRDLDSFEARMLPGTQDVGSPFWSPDSRFIAFGAQRHLKKIDVAGGSPQTIAEAAEPVGMGSWNADDVIVFGARGAGALKRVPAGGGIPQPMTAIDTERGEIFHSFPCFLPDGKHFAYFRASSNPDVQGIYIGSLDSAPEQQDRTRLVGTTIGPVQVTSGSSGGRLLYVLDGTLMSQSFDTTARRLAGAPLPVAEGIGSSGSFAFFTASMTNSLAYRVGVGTAVNLEQLAWFDRKGQELAKLGDPRGYGGPVALSPDGRTAAVAISATRALPDLWLIEFARGIFTRFTFHAAPDSDPVWSPDGQRIVFRSVRGRNADLYVKDASGAAAESLLLDTPALQKTPTDWSRDGRFILFHTLTVSTNFDVWALPMSGKKPVVLLQTEFSETAARFSPDGRWISYISNESGRPEIYLRPFSVSADGTPSVGGKWQVSKDGGAGPRWRRDSRELYFRSATGAVMTVDVSTGSGWATSLPRALTIRLPSQIGYDVSADGQQFLVSTPVTPSPSEPVSVVLNWSDGSR